MTCFFSFILLWFSFCRFQQFRRQQNTSKWAKKFLESDHWLFPPSLDTSKVSLTFIDSTSVVITRRGCVVRRSSIHGNSSLGLWLPVKAGGRPVRGEAVLGQRLIGSVIWWWHLLLTKIIAINYHDIIWISSDHV